MDQREITQYEIGFLVRTEDDARQVLQLLQGHKVLVVSQSSLSRIKLAYPIQKEAFAFFGYVHFSLDPGAMKALETDFRSAPYVLRFLIITPPLQGLHGVRGGGESPRRVAMSRGKTPAPDVLVSAPVPQKPVREAELSNEALEKKLEEILK